MRNAADVRYAHPSWQTAYPGHAVDLTALEFPPVRYDAGVDTALKLLDLGPEPSTEVVADIRDDVREMLFAAEDMECDYAAVLYPEPNRTADHVWLGFSVADNSEEPLTPVEALVEEVLGPAKNEVVAERIKEVALPDGPAARLFQAAVTRDTDDAALPVRPRLTLCGAAPSAGVRFVIRGHATSPALVEPLDKLVMTWARGVSFHGPATPGVVTVGTGRPESVLHPLSTPLPTLGRVTDLA